MDLLVSHHYLAHARPLRFFTKGLADKIDFLIDSGAFSAYNSGQEIRLDDYIESCKRDYHGRVWQYIQLDKIRDPKVSTQNLRLMRHCGLKPMPVFVVGHEYEYMQELIEHNEHVCVAGGVGTPDKFAWRRYQQAYKAVEGKVKIHALGFLRFPDIYQLPLYSGDSCSYANGSRFGALYGYHLKRGPYAILTKSKDILVDPRKHFEALPLSSREFLSNCNINFVDAVRKGLFTSKILSVTSFFAINAYLSFANDGLKHYKRRIFLAVDHISWMFSIIAVHLHKRGIYFDAMKAFDEYIKIDTIYKDKGREECLGYIRSRL